MFFKKHWFKFLLLFVAIVCAAVVWYLLDSLWVSMENYERAAESGAVQAYFDHFAAGDYDTAADTSGFPFTDKAPKEDYIRRLKDIFGSDFSNLRFAGRDGEVEGEKLYNIYAGSTLLGSVRLIPESFEGRDWKVIAIMDYAEPVSAVAPSYVTVSVNGVTATPLSDVPPVEDADFVPMSYLVTVPTRVSYRFEGYLYTPSVAAVGPDGTACNLKTDENGTLQFTLPTSAEQTEAVKTMMQEFSLAYSRWIATDGNFNAVKPYLDRTTTFYKDLTEFVNYWFTDHDGYDFRNIEITDLSRPAEGLLAGTIRFDHIIVYKGEERVYETSYRLLYRQVNDQWLLIGLTIL